jgi:hypothetical protein
MNIGEEHCKSDSEEKWYSAIGPILLIIGTGIVLYRIN